jgi:hypothetical protein
VRNCWLCNFFGADAVLSHPNLFLCLPLCSQCTQLAPGWFAGMAASHFFSASTAVTDPLRMKLGAPSIRGFLRMGGKAYTLKLSKGWGAQTTSGEN